MDRTNINLTPKINSMLYANETSIHAIAENDFQCHFLLLP